MHVVREPVVAGHFYPAERKALKEMLNNLFEGIDKRDESNEAIVPHAAYIYSGRTAAKTISLLKGAKTFIILSPNHTGLGSDISLSESNFWETPLGRVKVDKKLCNMLAETNVAYFDELAHIEEHSIEVIIPLLQHIFKKFKIVPITISSTKIEKLFALGDALKDVCNEEDVCLLASSDFSHFVPEKFAKEKDREAIVYIKKLDAIGFYNTVKNKALSICGASAIVSLLRYCKLKGRRKGILVEYTTSAKVSGDKSNVVGYAGIIFK